MKYYKIEYPVDAEDIGHVSSQIGKMVKNSFPFLQEIDFSKNTTFAETPIFLKEPKAKLSNFLRLPSLISHVSNLMIVDFKTKYLLEEFNLGNYQVFDMIVSDKEKYHRFYFLHFYNGEMNDRVIDYNNTEFVFKTDYLTNDDNLERIKFKDFDAYTNALRTNYLNSKDDKIKYGKYNVKKMTINNELIDSDIFYLSVICSGIYVSERIKTAIEKNKLTGIRFIPINEIVEPLPLSQ